MNIKRYSYSVSDAYLDYEFDSNGPKGKIRKIVRYSPQNANGITYFNLGFGDLNLKTGRIDDLAIIDNQDRDKILATKEKTSSKVKDYGNDPFFIKKAADSKAFLEKHGFPEDLLLKR